MRAILIDPQAAEITEVEIECAPTYTAAIDRLTALIGAEVDITRDLPDGHELWTDDTALLRGLTRFFAHRALPHAFAGRGVILGGGREGPCSARVSLDRARANLVLMEDVAGQLHRLDPAQPGDYDPRPLGPAPRAIWGVSAL